MVGFRLFGSQQSRLAHQVARVLSLVIIFSLLAALAVLPTSAASTSLVISEVAYDPSGIEPDDEWIEIYNPTTSTIDLSGFKIGDEETSGGGEGMLQFPSGASIAPGQVIIIANTASGFLWTYGFEPDYEMNETDAFVPNMTKYTAWASGSVALSNSGDEVLLLDGNDALVDAVSWGSSTFAFNPSAPDVPDGHSLERDPADVDTDSAADWVDQPLPDPGFVVSSPDPTPTSTSSPTPTPTATPDVSCGKSSSYTAVWEIQGNGHTSPYNGQQVSDVRGIVTANFQQGTGGPYELWGFFVQAHEPDCDAATSDGIFVYTGSSPKSIAVGDLVTLSGARVAEYQGPSSFTWELTLTQLDCRSGCSVSVSTAGYGLPAPLEYDPPQNESDALAYNEAREGMLVQVTVDSTVIAAANPYNELIMLRGTGLDRLHRDDPAHGHIITVDGDGIAAANCGQDGLPYIKTFDTITYNPAGGSAVYGPLNYNFNLYKVQQDDDRFCVGYTAGNDSSYDPADNPAPAADANVFTIGSFNAWNFFDTSDDPQKNEPLPTQAEYDLKSRKHADVICNTQGLNRPLVVGVQEIENDTVLQKLTGDISALCGVTYNYHTLAGPDDRSIQVGFLTRADRVTVLEYNDRQGCSATNWGVTYESNDHQPDVSCSGSTPYYLFNRPPLHLRAQVDLAGSTRTFHVIVNHFKSKLSSSACSQPDCTDWRVEQAQHVDNLVDSLLAADPNALIIVLGDLNDFYHSQPLDILDKTYGVLTNVWDDKVGPPSTGQGTITRYSYIHNGVSQTLDHLLVSDALNALARVVAPRHINPDWPALHMSDTSMYRSSDHDPLLVAFDFSSGGSPTPTPSPTATPAPTPTPTPTPAPSSTMHVGDLDRSASNAGGSWRATVTITVHDANENPIANATVTGTWSGGYSGSASCTTDSNGRCSVTTGNIAKKKSSVTFTVSGVSHNTLTYDSTSNHDPDSDSNGTRITVYKP